MFHIFGFYKFKKFSGLDKIKKSFLKEFKNKDIKGTIIISKEGINGTISGKNKDIQKLKKNLKAICKIKEYDSENNSKSNFQPFHKGKIKIKKKLFQWD